MSDAMVLHLFDEGIYKWDDENSLVIGRSGHPIFMFNGGRSSILFCRLYHTKDSVRYFRCIAVHHVSWIVGARAVIPVGWQVHHRDTNQENNRYRNLICCHPDDHRKLHQDESSGMEDIPF